MYFQRAANLEHPYAQNEIEKYYLIIVSCSSTLYKWITIIYWLYL